MSMFYKLNLEGSMFWQGENKGNSKIFSYDQFITRNQKELNTIYFKKVSENTYIEVTSGKKIIVNKDERYSLEYPKGVFVDTSNLILCSFTEVMAAYKAIRNKNLLAEYNKILKELLIYSHYCELVKEKKEENKKMKRILYFK